LNGCGPGSDRLSGICPGDSLIISDCKKSLAFVVSDVDGLPGTNHTEVKILHKSGNVVNGKKNIEGPFVAAGPEYQYETGREIVRMVTKFFYVGEGVNGPALFVRSGGGDNATVSELVEGVENLQVLYGEDSDSDNIPNRFVPADIVTDFSNVTAVRISILLRSVKELPWRTTAQKVRLLGGTNAQTRNNNYTTSRETIT